MKIQGKYLSIGREEKIILGLLSHYGVLKAEQIARYLPYITPETTDRLIERMIHRRLIYRCGSDEFDSAYELTADPTQKLSIVDNNKMQRAFWVIIEFMQSGRTNGKGHSIAEYPSQVMIIVNNRSIYEVVVVDEGDEIIASHLVNNRYIERSAELDMDNVKYIVVISSTEQIPRISIPNLHAFALVDNDTGEVKYIRPSAAR